MHTQFSVIWRAGGVVVSHLTLHQCVRGSIPATSCIQMVFQSMLALAGFLQDLRFPPALNIGTCLDQSKIPPFTRDVWGAAVLKVDVTI